MAPERILPRNEGGPPVVSQTPWVARGGRARGHGVVGREGRWMGGEGGEGRRNEIEAGQELFPYRVIGRISLGGRTGGGGFALFVDDDIDV